MSKYIRPDGLSIFLHVNGKEAIPVQHAAKDFHLHRSTVFEWICKGWIEGYAREGDQQTYVLRVEMEQVSARRRRRQETSPSVRREHQDAVAS